MIEYQLAMLRQPKMKHFTFQRLNLGILLTVATFIVLGASCTLAIDSATDASSTIAIFANPPDIQILQENSSPPGIPESLKADRVLATSTPLSQVSAEEVVAAIEAHESQKTSGESGSNEGQLSGEPNQSEGEARSSRRLHQFLPGPPPNDFPRGHPPRLHRFAPVQHKVQFEQGRRPQRNRGPPPRNPAGPKHSGEGTPGKPDLESEAQTLYDLRGFHSQLGQNIGQPEPQQFSNFNLPQQHQNFELQPQRLVSPSFNLNPYHTQSIQHQHHQTQPHQPQQIQPQQLQPQQLQPQQHQQQQSHNQIQDLRNSPLIFPSFFQPQEQAISDNQNHIAGHTQTRHGNIFGHNQHHQAIFDQAKTSERADFRPSQIDPSLTKIPVVAAQSTTASPTDNSFSFTPVRHPYVTATRPTNQLEQDIPQQPEEPQQSEQQLGPDKQESFVYVYEDVDYVDEPVKAKEKQKSSPHTIKTNQATAILIDTTTARPSAVQLPQSDEQIQYEPHRQLNSLEEDDDPRQQNFIRDGGHLQHRPLVPLSGVGFSGPNVEIVPSSERKPPPDQSNAIRPLATTTQKPVQVGRFAGVRDNTRTTSTTTTAIPEPISFDRYENPGQSVFEQRPSHSIVEEDLSGPSAEPPSNNIVNQFVRRPSSQRQTSTAPTTTRTTEATATKPPRRPQPTSPQLLTSGPDDLTDSYDYFSNEPQLQNHFGGQNFRPENQNGPQQFGRPDPFGRPEPFRPQRPEFGRPATPEPFGRPERPDHFARPEQFGRPAGPEQFGRPAGQEQFGRPAGPEQFGRPAGPEQFGRPAGQEQFGRPAGQEQFERPSGPEQFGRPAGQEQFGRPAGPEQFGRPERPEQFERPERPEADRKPDLFVRPERPEQNRRPEPSRRPERPERPEPSRRPERPERPEPSRRPERPEKSETSGRPERPEKPEPSRRPERPERPEFTRPERPQQSFIRPESPFLRPESPSPFTRPEPQFNAPPPTRGRPTTTPQPPPSTPSNPSPPKSVYEPQVLPPFNPNGPVSDEEKPIDNNSFSSQRFQEPEREVEEVIPTNTRRPIPVRSTSFPPAIRTTTYRTTTTTTTTTVSPVEEEELAKPVRPSIRTRFPAFRSTTTTTAAPFTTTETPRKRPSRIRGRQPGRIHKASTTPLPEVNQALDSDYEVPTIPSVAPSPTAPARIRSRPSFRITTTASPPSRPVRVHEPASTSTRSEGSRHVFERPTGRGPPPSKFESDIRDPEQERPNRFIYDRPTGRGPTNPPKPPPPPPRKVGKPLYHAGKMLSKEGGVYAGFKLPTYHVYGSPIPLVPVNQVFDRIPEYYEPPPSQRQSPARTLPPLAPQPTFASPSGPSPTFIRHSIPALEVSHEFDPNANGNYHGKTKINLNKLSRNRNIIQATTPESKPTESIRHTTVEDKFVRKQKQRFTQYQDDQTFPPSAPSPSAPARSRISGRKKRPTTTTTTTTTTTEKPYVVQLPYLPLNEPGVLTISEEHHTEPAPIYSSTYSTSRPPLIIQEELPITTTPKPPLRRRPGGRPTFKKPKPSLPTGNADEPQTPQPKPLPPRKLRARIRQNRRPRPTGPQPVDEQQPEEAKEIHEREAPPPPPETSTTVTTPEPPTTVNTQSSVRINKKPTEAPGRFSSRFREENPPFIVTKTPVQLTTKTRPSFKPKTTKRSTTTTTAVPRTTARRKVPQAEDALPPSVRLTAQDVLLKRKPARRLKPGSISLKLQEKRERLQGSRRRVSTPYSTDSEESNEAIENINNNKREITNQDAVLEPDNLLDEDLKDEGNGYNSTEIDSEETAAVLGIPRPTNGTNLEVVSTRVSTDSPRVYDDDEVGFVGFGPSGRKLSSPSSNKFSKLQIVMQRRASTAPTDTDSDFLTTQIPFNSEGARAIVSASLSTSYKDSGRSKLKINESQEAQESVLRSSTVQVSKGLRASASATTISPFAIFTMATQEPSLPLEAFFPIVSQNSKEAIS